ncbi:MAG: hypothetical protein ACXWXY_10905, partial [Aeromicrobium sp.]
VVAQIADHTGVLARTAAAASPHTPSSAMPPTTPAAPGPWSTSWFDEIAPHLEARYPLDPTDRGIGGIPLGGPFACWALLTRPAAVWRPLGVSPSLR